MASVKGFLKGNGIGGGVRKKVSLPDGKVFTLMALFGRKLSCNLQLVKSFVFVQITPKFLPALTYFLKCFSPIKREFLSTGKWSQSESEFMK